MKDAVPAVNGEIPAFRGVAVGLSPARWLAVPLNAVLVLIGVTALLRLVFASVMGLGIDETYMVAAGRHLQLSYFDHPPLSWWLARGAAQLVGSDAAIVVR